MSAICDPGEHASRGDSIVKATSIARENPYSSCKACSTELSFQSNMSVLRLPTSPVKVGILQPSNKANLSLKPTQILPDSTDENKTEVLFKKHHHR